ncbi:amidohydrolase family protein [Streptosporangium saharense]|uniref:amidohydrolase family protein n=1 Tax=Streptosporangium saharense TaxID=1706840 RepID=UPI0036D0DC1C
MTVPVFGQMRLALQHQRAMDCLPIHAEGRSPLRIDLTVRDAFTWATANGARIMGLESKIGSLTPGKLADVIVVKPRWDLVRSSFPTATVVLQSAAADLPVFDAEGLAEFVGQAERGAGVNYAQAYQHLSAC